MNPYKMLFEDPKYKKFTTVIGSIIIIVAMAGIFAYEAEAYKGEIVDLDDINFGSFGTAVYQIEWIEGGSSTLSESGSNDATVNFDISQMNLTSVEVKLTWTDDEPLGIVGALADTLSLTVTPPGLEVKSESGTSGEETVTYNDFESAPEPVEDVSSGDVAEHLETNQNEDGMGQWSVVVHVDAVGVSRQGIDTGNDWTLEVTYSWYEGKVSEMAEQ
jgi:hypothetical protein